ARAELLGGRETHGVAFPLHGGRAKTGLGHAPNGRLVAGPRKERHANKDKPRRTRTKQAWFHVDGRESTERNRAPGRRGLGTITARRGRRFLPFARSRG